MANGYPAPLISIEGTKWKVMYDLMERIKIFLQLEVLIFNINEII